MKNEYGCGLWMAGSLGNITKEIEMPKKIEKSGAAMPDCGNANGSETAVEQSGTDGKDKSSSSAIQEIPIERISPHPAVENLYPINRDGEVYNGILNGIKEKGYDARFPVLVLPPDERGIFRCYDGMTRIMAATEAGLLVIPCCITPLGSDREVVENAVRIQHFRRHNSPVVLIRSVEALHKIASEQAKSHQGRRSDLDATSGQDCPEVLNAREYIAKLTGMSASTMRDALRVMADAQLNAEVLAGEITFWEAVSFLKPEKKPKAVEKQDAQEEAPEEKDGQADSEEAGAGIPEEKPAPDVPSSVQTESDADEEAEVPVPRGLLKLLLSRFPRKHLCELDPYLLKCRVETAKIIRDAVVRESRRSPAGNPAATIPVRRCSAA